MFSKVLSAAVLGIEGYIVEVEIHLQNGLPRFHTVGLAEGAVKESKDRVHAAIRNSGFGFPARRITVNLAPADVRKEGSAFDLPMALGILAASGQISGEGFKDTVALGELALDGKVRPIRGGLSIAVAVRDRKIRRILVPEANGGEAAIAGGMEVFPVGTLEEAAGIITNRAAPEPYQLDLDSLFKSNGENNLDFSDVKGQEHVKRALEVAAAGGHNVMMIGPPGSGKTMLARRVSSILPELTLEEAIETTKIHSVAGQLLPEEPLITVRPFRSPHHTISDAGLIGGGQVPKPGEVSLAQYGVLFLDELPEFRKNVLEVLRQPLEDGRVTIARAAMTVSYPASFMLVAAMNPCPCGYFSSPHHRCTCTVPQIQRYRGKISGPLLDRIDIHVEVPALKYRELARRSPGEPSWAIRERTRRARDIQLQRFKGRTIYSNAQMGSRELARFCTVDKAAGHLLSQAISKLGLSARAYDRILKVARTIADIENCETIQPVHISEAIQYRSLDRDITELN